MDESTAGRSMLLFMAVPTDYARIICRDGFVGIPRMMYDTDEQGEIVRDEQGEPVEREVMEFCEFRDMPPRGLTFSLTTETQVEQTPEDEINVTISGGPVLADDMGDFVMAIEVPREMVREYEIHEDPPMGWPFREYWLPPDVANRYRDTLRVFVPESQEEIAAELLTREHELIVTEIFGDATAGAICVCGERWRWDPKSEDEPGPAFKMWADAHPT